MPSQVPEFARWVDFLQFHTDERRYPRYRERDIQTEKQRVIIDSQMGLNENGRLDFLEGFPSGQRGQTVNLLAQPS